MDLRGSDQINRGGTIEQALFATPCAHHHLLKGALGVDIRAGLSGGILFSSDRKRCAEADGKTEGEPARLAIDTAQF